jgi:GGDEF domain-containing protein
LHDPITLDGTVVDVGFSVGVARYPDDGQDLTSVMRNADRAMYAAKRRGGGITTYTHAAANEGTGRRDDASSRPESDDHDGGPAAR